jgi:hypothetical protein
MKAFISVPGCRTYDLGKAEFDCSWRVMMKSGQHKIETHTFICKNRQGVNNIVHWRASPILPLHHINHV